MTTDELNAIVKAVMDELEKAGVDFDFKAETPQADDLVYVMRGTADKYQGITVKWQNLLGIIVQKATEARDDAITAKDIALQTLATIQGIESNVSSMKSSVETMTNNVSSMKASVEASESNVTQMKSDVSEMKTSVEGTKTEVEGLKSDVTALKAQTQTIVDNAKEEVTGLLDTKVDKSSVLTYDNIIASTPPMDLDSAVASASALKHLKPITILKTNTNSPSTSYVEQTNCRITIPANSIFGIYVERGFNYSKPMAIIISTNGPDTSNYDKYPIAYDINDGTRYRAEASMTRYVNEDTDIYVYAKDQENNTSGYNTTRLYAWYIKL